MTKYFIQSRWTVWTEEMIEADSKLEALEQRADLNLKDHILLPPYANLIQVDYEDLEDVYEEDN